MSSSDFFWQVYGLLLEKSLLDDMDLEMVEEYYLTSEREALISSKFISCVSIMAAIIVCGFATSHQIVGLLLCPSLFIGLLAVAKRFCYCIISSYINLSADFDSVFHRIVAAIRSREITFFGLRKKFDINPTVCLHTFRLELLKALRSEVQCYVRMTKHLCRCDDSEKLLCEMFTLEMSRLALEDDVCDEFLQLSALKELWQLSFLLRSEYFRLFLLHLSRPSHRLVLVFLDLFLKTLLIRSSKSRLSRNLEFINYRDCCVTEKRRKFSPFLSTTEKIRAHLSFASEILNGNEIPEGEKFLYVAEILKKAIELSVPQTHTEQEDMTHLNLSSNSSTSGGTDEVELAAGELPVEKVYEGLPFVSDDLQNDVFLSSWQEAKSNDAVARSMVVELKSRLAERMKEMNEIKTAKIDSNQQMKTVENEFQEMLAVGENCDAEKATDREDFSIFSSISKNNGVFQSNVKLDLKQAISLIKLGPSVDFVDDPENECDIE